MPGRNERGPAPGGRGGRGGNDRDGKRGGRGGGRGGRDDKRGGAGSQGYRVVNELGTLEKALSKADYAAQRQSLEEVLKSLRSLRLRSIDGLDLGTKGKLLTSLLRVGRQPKPPDEAPAAPPPAEAAPPPPADAPPADAPPAEGAPPPEAAPTDAEAAPPAAETPATEAAPAAPAAPAADAPPSKLSQWQDVMQLLGRIWRSLGDEEKATRFFEASGRAVPEAEAAVPDAPPAASSDGSRPPPRGPRSDRGPRVERMPPGPRAEKLTPGDWRYKAREIEEKGRTRDAAKMHEEHESWPEASRLYEVGGDYKAALRAAFRAKDEARVEKLKAHVPADEVPKLLEQAQAWEQLMEHHVKTGNYDAVARLYERAKQFDQAALAYERAGKLSLARKAYERAKDLPAANRVRDLEVKKLIERGDRLGAATLLIAASMKDAAIEALKGLPGPKAFRFMQKLKLDAEALEFAKTEVEKAIAEKAHATHARWLEMLGDTAAAVEAWMLAERKDKALPLLEQLGNWAKGAEIAEAIGQLDKAQELFHRANDQQNAERVAKLPRPAVQPAPPPPEPGDEDVKPSEAPAAG